MKVVKENSTIDVDYEGRLEDGTLFDTSKKEVAEKEGAYAEEREYTPLHVQLGNGSLIKGFESALIGMEEGETKTVTIKAADAYGESKEDLSRTFPKDKERDKELKEGMMLMVNVEERQFPARVLKVTEEEVTIDFNHPLAGKDLTFKLTIIKIEE